MNINGQLHSLTRDRNGKYLLTIVTGCDIASDYDNLHGQQIKCEIKPHRAKRSLDANAYFWVLLDKLAEKIKIPKTEIYKDMIREIGGNNTTALIPTNNVDEFCRTWSSNGIGWITDTFPTDDESLTYVILYAGSSTYDSQQMSRLIDLLIWECEQQDIETITPKEKDLLIERWRNKHD